MAEPALVKNPSTTKSGRRVAFEVPSSNNHHSHSVGVNDIGTSIDHFDKGRKHPCCFACCAWSCLVMFIFIIILLFTGISYVAFLKAELPKVNVRSFNVTKLEIDNSSQKMDSVVTLGLRFFNKNEKFKLLYGPLSVDVTSEDVPLGMTKLSGFSQMPHNDTDFDMTMTMNHVDVNKYAVDDLKSDINAYEIVFDVYVSGKIGMKVGNLHMINIPFLSSCHQIKKMDVDFGRRPECDVKMFAFRPSSN